MTILAKLCLLQVLTQIDQLGNIYWLVDLKVHFKMCIRCYLRKQCRLYDTRSNLELALDLSSATS